MADTEDDARFPPNSYSRNQGYSSPQHQKLPVRSPYSPHAGDRYAEDDNEGEEDELDEEGHDNDNENENQNDNNNDNDNVNVNDNDNNDNEVNGFTQIDKDDDEDDVDVDGGVGDENEDGNNEDEDDTDSRRHQKKRKLKSLLSSYEFAPRAPTSSEAAAPVLKPSFGGRNSLADWTENETLLLLDAWGERFLQHGRKSLRSDEWQEVAEKVSQDSKRERTDTQCRNRLDTLKKKYKKETMKLRELRLYTSKWGYFSKMDLLLSGPPQQAGSSRGVSFGDHPLIKTKASRNHTNGLEETGDATVNSESARGKGYDSDGLPPKKPRNRAEKGNGAYFRVLADSILKFSEIYEKIENGKRKQILELEKMRMDFHRDLELQKREIVEKAQAEIAKIRRGYDEENDVSVENVSG